MSELCRSSFRKDNRKMIQIAYASKTGHVEKVVNILGLTGAL